jgi:hypothetical protein
MRVNQTWEKVIRCYVHPLLDEQLQHLINVDFTINAAVSMLTTKSPFKATLGFKPMSPTTAPHDDNEFNRTLSEQVNFLVEMHRFAADRVKAARVYMQ